MTANRLKEAVMSDCEDELIIKLSTIKGSSILW